MSKLDEQLDRTEDTFRAVSTLQALFQAFPGDMHPDFQTDTLEFFQRIIEQLHALRF